MIIPTFLLQLNLVLYYIFSFRVAFYCIVCLVVFFFFNFLFGNAILRKDSWYVCNASNERVNCDEGMACNLMRKFLSFTEPVSWTVKFNKAAGVSNCEGKALHMGLDICILGFRHV